MEYKDRVYGSRKITEPVILDLIDCVPIQRLKKIDQAGYFAPFYPGTEHSRFEHSMGVYLLLSIYGASLEEQIAGLIHDASHSAFSHCVDYVLDSGSPAEQSYQDDIFDEFIRRSEILGILKKYRIDPEYILEESNFPLKENNLPDLCADRIDYSLRMAVIFGQIQNADEYLKNLIAENGKWIFKNFENAKSFAELFRKLNIKYLSGLESAVMFSAVGDYLRCALRKGYISEKDLYSTDYEVLAKIEKPRCQDKELQRLFNRMSNKTEFKNDANNYDSKVVCKSRIVDPLCLMQGKISRVSDIDSDWRKIIESESKPKTYYIKFID